MLSLQSFHACDSHSAAPGYISELATPNKRGLLGALVGVFIGFGYCCGGFIGLAFYYAENETLQWRGPLGIGLIWPLLMLVICPFVPESPRYLLMKNKTEAAWAVVSMLHDGPKEEDHLFALAEFSQMKQQADFDRDLDGSWLQLIKKPSYRKRLILASGISFLGQSTAVLVLNNYVCSAACTIWTRLMLFPGTNILLCLGV